MPPAATGSTRPSRGIYLGLNATQAPRWPGSDWTALRLAPEVRTYVPLPLDIVFAQRFAIASLFVLDAASSLDAASIELGPTTYRLRGGGASSKEEWEDQNGSLVEAYSRDLSAAVNTINQGERQNTINTCTQVKDDANEVKSTALPVPNNAVDGPLRTAVESGIKAADACLNGARNTDARAVEAAQRDFAEARKSMDAAEAAIRDLKGAGFTEEQIGVAMQDPEPCAHAAEGAATGALSGGMLGGLVGLLGSLLIPGVGPIVIGGVRFWGGTR